MPKMLVGQRKKQKLLDYIANTVEKFALKQEDETITAKLCFMSQYLNEFTLGQDTLTALTLLSRNFREHYVVITKFNKTEELTDAENRFNEGLLEGEELTDLISNIELPIKDIEVLPILDYLHIAEDIRIEASQFDMFEYARQPQNKHMRVVEGEEMKKIQEKNATYYS